MLNFLSSWAVVRFSRNISVELDRIRFLCITSRNTGRHFDGDGDDDDVE
jgi:hypothetical protein